MNRAAEIVARAEASGVRLAAEGAGIRVTPKGALPGPLRAAIQANREEILTHLRNRAARIPEAALMALVERVARHYRATPGDLEVMKRVALEDPPAAMSTFLATIEADGIA